MTKATALFLTEAQLAERIGLSIDLLRSALPALDKAGFPAPDPLFGNRRYWPACQAFLDRRYGLAASLLVANPGLDGVEKWD
ncbi:winged helix-turn-helix domain-containing protein [Rhizobiaceae bacterium n13]|uniref:winged helix-turn-helix domain-containing protein n=1 Tax=Ferirhizobium litorale TaxID=2927786 RepID=UPI0024B2A08A|nr:winged helix-turn-helix domain-containing protein [Fererhizobium litorale]MDI7862571.1 winged helix-turn-helix domain-containing protein [Fererhizobium litorale]